MGASSRDTPQRRRIVTAVVTVVGAYFERLARVLVAPKRAFRAALGGRWDVTADALILVVLGALVCHTPEVVKVLYAFWDLGVREGVKEISWSLGRRLMPDFLALLVMGALVLLPLWLTGRRSFERALALGIACWIPFFLVRLLGAAWRLQAGLGPSRPLEGPEWWVGLGWSGVLIVLGLNLAFRDDDA